MRCTCGSRNALISWSWLIAIIVVPVVNEKGFARDGGNAALVYYQALLLHPESSEMPSHALLQEVVRGAIPDPSVRSYLDASRETIEMAMKATRISYCDWASTTSPWGMMPISLMNLTDRLRRLVILLDVDARVWAVDGEYHMATERALGVRRLATHIVEETALWYPLSLEFHTSAFKCIQNALGYMSPADDALTWLQGQLVVQGPAPLPARTMEIALEDALRFLSQNPESVETWRKNVVGRVANEGARGRLLSLSNDDLLNLAKSSYERFMASANRLMGSDLAYEQKRAGLRQIAIDLEHQAGGDDPVVGLVLFLMPDVREMYDAYVLRAAHFNAIRAAVEVYLVKAMTTQLPDTLPAGLSKDPYSGLDFEYEKTKDGFIFRCRNADAVSGKVQEYLFKVRS